MSLNSNVDIVKKIAYIEKLKCKLLLGIGNLFESMADTSSDISDKKEILAEMLMLTYLLSSQIGIDCEALSAELISQLKAELITNDQNAAETKALLRYLLNK